jgi:carbon-monoxide dehydrogenase large subunit
VVAPAIGGGFGAKGDLYPEHAVVAASAIALDRPVRWLERRSENFVNMVHGRNQIQDVALAADRDGRVTGLSVDIVADVGAYPGVATWLPRYTVEMASGTYDIPEIRVQFASVATNTTPGGPYRGAGRPEAIQMIERMMDLLAAELHLDPVEVRRRNLIPPFEETHVTASGAAYDSGNYPMVLDTVLSTLEYQTWIGERARRRAKGTSHPIGVGVSTYVEVTVGETPDHDHATVRVLADGTIEARCGGSSHGQGHETAFAMIVADRFDVPMERIAVIQSDTDLVARGGGTYASRTLQLAGSSLFLASQDVIEDARRAAAGALEAAPEDLVIVPGVGLGVAGDPGSTMTWSGIATLIESGGEELSRFRDERQGASSYPFGAHLAVVEVDVETGWCRLLAHVAVDDCGTIINPMLVKGQQHGGIAQGAGQALFEHMQFDEAGFPVTANMASYSIPAAPDLPSFVVMNTCTPTALNPLGAKGIGEAGTLGSTPAIHSAVVDALASFGVRHVDMPLTPHTIWRAINGQ